MPIESRAQYLKLKKPIWAPPGWLFGAVWPVLYIIIAVSFTYVGYLFLTGEALFREFLPFVLNIIFNLLYVPLQFRKRDLVLATVDVFLVGITLLWGIVVIYALAPWVSILNIPYLGWIIFACILQVSITLRNTR